MYILFCRKRACFSTLIVVVVAMTFLKIEKKIECGNKKNYQLISLNVS